MSFRLLAILAVTCPVLLGAETVTIKIDLDSPGHAISPLLYGIFFEDINRAGDGGLYGEMLQNRSFEDFNLPIGWTLLQEGSGQISMSLDKSQPLNSNNSTSLRVEIASSSLDGRVGIINQGYKGLSIPSKDPVTLPRENSSVESPENRAWRDWINQFSEAQKQPENGLNIEQGKTYHLSFYARIDPSFHGSIIASLEKQDGTLLASQKIECDDTIWKKYQAELTATATDSNARFVLSFPDSGRLWLDMVSLFPEDTFNRRPNGLRADMMEKLIALHPAFVRFPGGSFGEGYRLSEAFRWKETIGDLAQRPGQWNIWGYRTTNGLGYHEYLQMCEDLKAEPLFVINCGMAEKNFADPKDLDHWIQDALDAVEYANGPETGSWGSLRAAAGHPAPFNLHLIELGNENGMGYFWGGGNAQEYAERYTPLYRKLKAAYPDIKTIATAPINQAPIHAPVEIVDEHYYPTAEWFEDHASIYDTYDRSGPKVYVGEYATKSGAGNGNLNAALGEAAFMTGMERNSDLVVMSSYAPLFANPQWQEWTPDLIVFNSSKVYGTPSYYNQLLFANNRPDVILPLSIQDQAASDSKARASLYAVAGKRIATGEVIVKVVNICARPKESQLKWGDSTTAWNASATTLTSTSPSDENSFGNPARVSPKDSDLGNVDSPYSYTFPPYSITVIHLKPK